LKLVGRTTRTEGGGDTSGRSEQFKIGKISWDESGDAIRRPGVIGWEKKICR